MKYFRYILLFMGVVYSWGISAQTASDLYFYQDGTTIVLTYSLDQMANVSVQVSTDGGVRYSAPLQHVSGDVGDVLQAGDKRIVWDVLAEYDKFVSDKVVFKLIAQPVPADVQISGVVIDSESESGYPLIGATILATGTAIYTIADFDGNFELEVPRYVKTLTVSYFGYETQVVPVERNMRIVLYPEKRLRRRHK